MAAPLWAQGVTAPLLEEDRLARQAEAVAAEQGLPLSSPALVKITWAPQKNLGQGKVAQKSKRLSDGRIVPDLTAQLGGGGFTAQGIQVKLNFTGPLSDQAAQKLQSALAQKIGPLAKGDWLDLGVAQSTAPAAPPEATPEEPPATTSDLTLKPANAPRSLEPLQDEPSQEPIMDREQPYLIWGLGLSVAAVLVLALFLRRRAESPEKDMARLAHLKVEGEVDFTELKDFKGLFKENSDLDLDSVKTDLCELLRLQPDWARELAVDRGPRGLARIMAVFGPGRSQQAFGEALEKPRIAELLSEAADLFFSPEEENKLLMELHQHFFLDKLRHLKDEKQKAQTQPAAPAEPAPKKPVAPSPTPHASLPEEQKALAFLKDAESDEIYRLIVEETPLIQALVLRHWNGEAEALAERLQHPASLAEERKKKRSLAPDLLAQIARGLQTRLEEQRAAAQVDPTALGEALQKLETLGPVEREEFMVRLEEKEVALGTAVRQSYFPWEELPKLDSLSLRRSLSTLDPEVLAQALFGLSKSLQEPILLALNRGPRSALIQGLRERPPQKEQALKARGLLAQALSTLRKGF
ncbi:MAG: FliG C-terminal domain-containing protein [bacterium]|nr:FliG C-terminal domain-containing protein [bacterium]